MWKRLMWWSLGFLAFIVGGAAATALVGRIDDPVAALVGGATAGAVIGTGQWLAARGRLGDPRVWIPATALAMGTGLLAAGATVGYGTGLRDLALRGAITGLVIGAVQAYLLRRRLSRAWIWAAAMPPLWALGWTVTTLGGIDVDRQFAVFGAYGAVTVTVLLGLLLESLTSDAPDTAGVAAAPAPAPAPVR
jgi:hypothetical protein